MNRICIITLLIAAFCSSAIAQKRESCIVCNKGPLVGTIWKHPHGTICPDCVKRDIKCDICSLPIRDNYLKTKDGRYICKFEKDDVVVDEKQANVIFDRAVDRVLYISRRQMKLRGPKPGVKLFDIDYWNQGSNMRRGGFSQTRQVGNRYTHNVILLSGQPMDELVSVCAHEYTHLWINENKKPNRDIEGDTIEGICELVAYKVCEAAGFTNQLERIKKNPYTKGRILTMLEADKQFGFFKVLDWVRNGRNPTVTLHNQGSTARTTSPPMARTPTRSTPAPRPPITSSSGSSATRGLRLTSISRTARGYRAQINGVMFYRGDLKRVTINGRPANVQCLQVTGNSASISVNRSNPQTLRMGR